jgi:hypothetical protein
MSSTDLQLPTTMEDAERFQRLFVLPLMQAFEARIQDAIQPVLDGHRTIQEHLARQDNTIAALIRDQKKALLGWSFYATGAAALLAWGWGFVKSHIRIG